MVSGIALPVSSHARNPHIDVCTPRSNTSTAEAANPAQSHTWICGLVPKSVRSVNHCRGPTDNTLRTVSFGVSRVGQQACDRRLAGAVELEQMCFRQLSVRLRTYKLR